MRIAFVIEQLTGGGAERVTQQLAEAFTRRGHVVYVYCLDAAGLSPDAIPGVMRVREFHSVGRDPCLAIRLCRQLRGDQIDVINAQSSAAAVWCMPAAVWLRIPLLHTRHGVLLGKPLRYPRIANRIAPLFARTAIVAESLRETLPHGRVRRQAVCLPNCIDRAAVPRAESRRLLESLVGERLAGPIVLSVGTICPEKDTCGLLRAFALLVRCMPAARLIIAGPTRGQTYAERVRKLERALQLERCVHWLGPTPDAYRLMAGADVFCLPSRTEAMPLAVIEAMSQRVPIVATAVGAVGRLRTQLNEEHFLIRHPDTGLLVRPSDPPSLASALAESLSDTDAAQRRARRAHAAYLTHHTSAGMCERYETVFEQLTRSRSRSGTCEQKRNRRPMRHRPTILMIGPAAPIVGGMVSAADTLERSIPRGEFNVERFATSQADHGAPRGGIARLCGAIDSAGRHVRQLFRLIRTIRRLRPSVLHIHTCSYFSFYRSLADLAIGRLFGCKTVLHIHGGRFGEFCQSAGPTARMILRRGARAADAVVVLSESWRERLTPHLPGADIRVIPNGVRTDRVRRTVRSRPDTPCRFLFLGALVPAKGIAELLDAMARLRDRGEEAHLTLAGPARRAHAARWRAMCARLALQDVVHWSGPLPAGATARLLAASDCLVLPSHAEGLPLVILEAAAAGLAVVATNVGAVAEAVTDQHGERLAALVAPHDVEALTDAMRRLANDPRQRALIGDALRAHVATHFSADVQAKRFAALYRGLVRSVAPRRRSTPSSQRRNSVRLDEAIVRRLLYPLHERLRGRRTLAMLRDLQRLARLSPEDVRNDSQRRIGELLRYARANLPFYAQRFEHAGIRFGSDRPSLELAKLPPLTKSEIRRNANELTNPRVPGGAIACSSGGTSGDTLHFAIDRVRQAQGLAARLFMQELFGVRVGDRRAYLWGAPLETRRSTLRRLRDRAINEILLDAFDLSSERLDQHIDALLAFKPRCVYGYPTAAAALAQRAAQRCDPNRFAWLRLFVLTGEEVTPEHRRQVAHAFGCSVAVEYGSRETGMMAHECPRGTLHVVCPHMHVEVARSGQAVEPETIGEILVTTLNTRAQPFIRYRIGDLGARPHGDCDCGLPFPTLRVQAGKVTGFITLPDGRLSHGAITSHMLRGEAGIVAFKTIQHAVDEFEVLLVTDDRFDRAAIARIHARYLAAIGPNVHVTCRLVDEIPPDPSGKRRYVVSHVAQNTAAIEVDACSVR